METTPPARSVRRSPPCPPVAPSAAALHAAALAHLARFAATEAGLRAVLERRVQRWARAAGAAGFDPETIAAEQARARSEAAAIATRLAAAGAVDDAAFAAARARRLHRAGRSRRAIAAHLAAKGVGAETAAAALPGEAEAELAAALALARRRRIGPFAAAPEPDLARRALGVLARAGFPRDVADRALHMGRDEAEALVLRLRRG